MKTEGELQLDMLEALLETLPMDLTLIDADDRVIAWSESRILFRIGDEVMGTDIRECHPERSMPALEKLLDDMKEGRIDSTRTVKEVTKNGIVKRFLIQYLAIRDPENRYMGCLEMDMDLTDIPEPDSDGGKEYQESDQYP